MTPLVSIPETERVSSICSKSASRVRTDREKSLNLTLVLEKLLEYEKSVICPGIM